MVWAFLMGMVTGAAIYHFASHPGDFRNLIDGAKALIAKARGR